MTFSLLFVAHPWCAGCVFRTYGDAKPRCREGSGREIDGDHVGRADGDDHPTEIIAVVLAEVSAAVLGAYLIGKA